MTDERMTIWGIPIVESDGMPSDRLTINRESVLAPAFFLRHRLGHGMTRMIWTGPAVRHPGYARTTVDT